MKFGEVEILTELNVLVSDFLVTDNEQLLDIRTYKSDNVCLSDKPFSAVRMK